MLAFLLFMAYKSNIITGVNLLAAVIYQGPMKMLAIYLFGFLGNLKGFYFWLFL